MSFQSGASSQASFGGAPWRRVGQWLPLRACGAAILTVLLYASALDNPFVYDDFRLIVENPSIQNLSGVLTILARDVTRPLVTLSYALDTALWGTRPFGYHLTNVLLHALNVVAGVLGRLRRRRRLAPAWRRGLRRSARRRGGGHRHERPVCRAPGDDPGRGLHHRPIGAAVRRLLSCRDPRRAAVDARRRAVAIDRRDVLGPVAPGQGSGGDAAGGPVVLRRVADGRRSASTGGAASRASTRRSSPWCCSLAERGWPCWPRSSTRRDRDRIGATCWWPWTPSGSTWPSSCGPRARRSCTRSRT